MSLRTQDSRGGRTGRSWWQRAHSAGSNTRVRLRLCLPLAVWPSFMKLMSLKSTSLSSVITSITSQGYTGIIRRMTASTRIWQSFRPALLHDYSRKHKAVILCPIIHELIHNFIKKGAKMGVKKCHSLSKWLLNAWSSHRTSDVLV